MHVKYFRVHSTVKYCLTGRKALYSGLPTLRFYVRTAVAVELTVWDVTPCK
jgi:hypothetical protein